MSPHRADVLTGLVQAGREMSVSLSLETTLKVSVESAVRLTSARFGAIVLLGPEERVSHSSAWDTDDDPLEPAGSPADILPLLLHDRRGDSLVVRAEYRSAPGAAPRPILGGILELYDELLGVLYLVGRRGVDFTIDDEIALESFIQHTTLSIANACLHWRAEERGDKLAVLGRLTRFITSTTDSARIFNAIAKVAAILLDTQAARVWVAEPDQGLIRIRGSFGLESADDPLMIDRSVLRIGEGVVGSTVASCSPEFLVDVQHDPRWVNRRLAEDADLHGFACLPLVVEQRVLGALSIFFGRRSDFSGEEKELMTLLADQAAIAMDNARLFEQSERRRHEAEVLATVVRTLNRSLRVDTVLHSVTEAAKRLCRSDLARIALEEPGTGAFRFRYSVGGRVRRPETPLIFPGHGLAGAVLTSGRPARSDRVTDDPRTDRRFLALLEEEGLVTTLVVPIRVENDVEGLIYVDNRTARPFTDSDEAVLVRLAEHAAVAIRNARLFEEASRRRRVADGLVELARALVAARSPGDVAARVTASIHEVLGASVELFGLDGAAPSVRLGGAGEPADAAVSGERKRLLHLAVAERRVAAGDPAQPWAGPSVVCVPLLLHGRPLGAVVVTRAGRRGFWPHEVQVLEAVASHAALALAAAR